MPATGVSSFEKEAAVGESFAPGAAVWIVANLEASKWARKIDWHLNSQIMKAGRHVPRSMAKELTEILTEQEEASPSVSVAAEAPLMIASSDLLPNQVTVMVPYRGDVAQWTKECARIASDLRVKSVRVFMPDGVKSASVRSAWPSSGAASGIETIQLLDLP